MNKKGMYKYVKRWIDIIMAFVTVCLFLPILLLLVLLLAIANNGQVFFFQHRPGLNGRIFKIVKFKTMNDKRDSNGELLPDALRLTRIGKIVRKLSLDEIPQMINVLKGDMSLVGPRPLLVEYLPLYNKEQARRHDVRPGITGWAQVNGRNAISWQKRFELDIYYVDNVSLRLDLKILILTLQKVLKREGISDGVSQTMKKFKGN